MRIGFDAKRAFYNHSGLGNYSRDVIKTLVHDFPAHEYHLYSPAIKNAVHFLDSSKVTIGLPTFAKSKILSSYWRSFLLSDRLKKDKIEIYHGLSNELPANINKSGVKSIVTIHDLIFIRHPEWYKPIDCKIYEKKFRYSCEVADKIIAVSKQTKSDLVEFFGIEENKIDIVYQGCNDIFMHEATTRKKTEVKLKYNLPENYLLYVGTIEERKNLLQVVRAIHKGNISSPLVIIGKPTSYLAKIKEYIASHNLKGITFLHNIPQADLPAIYQNASVFIYPSIFEGFGIPILEALWSKVPVITSMGGCFNEVGGSSSKYIDPKNVDEISHIISELLDDPSLCQSMIDNGYNHAQQFTAKHNAQYIMNIYTNLVNGK